MSKAKFFNCKTQITIICNDCSYEFEIRPSSILRKEKTECEGCKGRCTNLSSFLIKAKKKYGDLYDYSLVEYKKFNEKVTIICTKCNTNFQKIPVIFLNENKIVLNPMFFELESDSRFDHL